MTSLIDGVRLSTIGEHFEDLAGRAKVKTTSDPLRSNWACRGGCGRSICRGDMCADCLRLVADACRSAAAKADHA